MYIPSARSLDRALYAVGAGVFLFHFVSLLSHAVNVPFWDEWDCLNPGALDATLEPSWLVSFHNEHRVVPAKLQIWLLYRVAGWNHVTEVALSFLLYAGFVALGFRVLSSRFEVRLGLFFALFASTLSWENHNPGSNFLYYLVFFFLAVWLLVKEGRWSWLGVPAAWTSAFSLSAGVLCAVACAGLAAALAVRRPVERWDRLAQAVLIAIGVGVWFTGYHGNPAHPPLSFPWEAAFWTHFLNLVALGFGHTTVELAPGIACFSAVVLGLGWGIWKWGRVPPSQQDSWLALLVVAGTLLVCAAAISAARAGFGAEQAKSPRYAEALLWLIPIVWILACQATKPLRRGSRLAILGVLAVVLLAPFTPHFQFQRVYREGFLARLEGRACLARYFRGEGDGTCPTLYPGNLATRLERARELGLSFVDEVLAASGAARPPER